MELDDVSTWPAGLAEWVQERIPLSNDSSLRDEDRDEFLAQLAGHPIQAYHVSRLLDHEVEWLRVEGLHPPTAELVGRRLKRAVGLGYISAEQRTQLEQATTKARAMHRSRFGKVFLFLGTQPLQSGGHGLKHLLAEWGGEGIYGEVSKSVAPELKTMGSPALVVCNVDLAAEVRAYSAQPFLWTMFRRQLGDRERDWVSTLAYREPVTVDAVWQPGDHEYDRWPGLVVRRSQP